MHDYMLINFKFKFQSLNDLKYALSIYLQWQKREKRRVTIKLRVD